jgi:actin-related protein 10
LDLLNLFLLKLPIDLRRPLAASIVVSGGTTLLPGFIPRVRRELLRALSESRDQSPFPSRRGRTRQPRATFATRFSVLSSLSSHVAILNDTRSFEPNGQFPPDSGRAPPFSPGLLGWIGGSLAGALKTGGVEVLRDRWDEAGILEDDGEEEVDVTRDDDEDLEEEKEEMRRQRRAACLPDWLGPLVR